MSSLSSSPSEFSGRLANLSLFFGRQNTILRSPTQVQTAAEYIRTNPIFQSYSDNELRLAFRSALVCTSRSQIIGLTTFSPIHLQEQDAYYKLLSAGYHKTCLPAHDLTNFVFRKFQQSPKDYNLEFIGLDNKNNLQTNYQIKGSYSIMKTNVLYSQTYMDSAVALSLVYQGEPIALISFIPGGNTPGTLLVNQIQGFKTKNICDPNFKDVHQPGLTQVDWRRYLIARLEDVAHKVGFSVMGIQSADNNEWANLPGHISKEQATKVYDETARYSGYELGIDGNYYKKLAK